MVRRPKSSIVLTCISTGPAGTSVIMTPPLPRRPTILPLIFTTASSPPATNRVWRKTRSLAVPSEVAAKTGGGPVSADVAAGAAGADGRSSAQPVSVAATRPATHATARPILRSTLNAIPPSSSNPVGLQAVLDQLMPLNGPIAGASPFPAPPTPSALPPARPARRNSSQSAAPTAFRQRFTKQVRPSRPPSPNPFVPKQRRWKDRRGPGARRLSRASARAWPRSLGFGHRSDLRKETQMKRAVLSALRTSLVVMALLPAAAPVSAMASGLGGSMQAGSRRTTRPKPMR